jgi:hypothetical protein
MLELIFLEQRTRIIVKNYSSIFGLVALACANASCAAEKYKDEVVQLACGESRYALTSSCIKSKDPFELNECKPQSLAIENKTSQRRTMLPELPKNEVKRIQASGGNIKSLFVVSWSCSKTTQGPIATLKYSTGGGSAEHAETWTHYSGTGKLVESGKKLNADEVMAVDHNFKKVPSIMPD